MEITSLNELFEIINANSELKLKIINILKKYPVKLDLFYFLNQHFKMQDKSLDNPYLEEIIKNLYDNNVRDKKSMIAYSRKKEEERKSTKKISLKDLIHNIEYEFQERLNPTDIKRVKRFIFDYDVSLEIINEALAIAVRNNVLNLAYIEGVLRNFKKRDIHTIDDYIKKDIATIKKKRYKYM